MSKKDCLPKVSKFELKKIIADEKKKNIGIEPDINKLYWCEFCGSKTGKCHPYTGMCFICGKDDWEPYDIYKVK